MGKTKRNVSGLLHHAATLKADTEEKVNSAIDSLKRSKSKKINFKTVSETSGISTTTLYNNPVLRARISSLRAVQIQSAQKNSAHRISEREKIRLHQAVKFIQMRWFYKLFTMCSLLLAKDKPQFRHLKIFC